MSEYEPSETVFQIGQADLFDPPANNSPASLSLSNRFCTYCGHAKVLAGQMAYCQFCDYEVEFTECDSTNSGHG